MRAMAHGLTLGVEEEFFVVDPVTRAVVIDGRPVLDRLDEQGLVGDKGSYDQELWLSMIESRTEVCQGLGEVRAELQRLRATLVRAAGDTGRWVVTAGTLPTVDWRTQRITPKPRYEQIAKMYQLMVHQKVTCGCHVHVGISDRETAVQVLNRVRPWLPALLALSASSPFWMGQDTGYASYRAILWGDWPMAGIPGCYRSATEYRTVTQSLIDTGTIVDSGQLYWDVRLGNNHETLEFRIADACATIDEAVLQAGLCRALVRACMAETASRQPLPDVRPELLGAARWRAARSGLDGNLLDALTAKVVPATVLLDGLLAYLRRALEDVGDWDEVAALVEQTQRRGTSAQRQRRTLATAQHLEDVVDLLATETASS
ncbi:MAG: carboxylate-amine ligase [Egibacteraceae bacterium]